MKLGFCMFEFVPFPLFQLHEFTPKEELSVILIVLPTHAESWVVKAELNVEIVIGVVLEL